MSSEINASKLLFYSFPDCDAKELKKKKPPTTSAGPIFDPPGCNKNKKKKKDDGTNLEMERTKIRKNK